MNNGNGTLARLVRDPGMANAMDNTISNLEKGTKGFSENMEAAKSNFLLKGYFKKKEKEKEKKIEEAKDKKEEQQEKLEKEKEEKLKEEKKKAEETAKKKEEEAKKN